MVSLGEGVAATGGDGLPIIRFVVPGSVNGHTGNFVWIIDNRDLVVHRFFEEVK
jgi:hypothetical protein